jgi:DnaB-like helicase N terminal domain/AAA domain
VNLDIRGGCLHTRPKLAGQRATYSYMNSDPTIERPLPHSLEAERAILGAILLGGTHTDEAISHLQPSDFFLPHHRVLFRHMSLLRERGKPTNDIVLLYDSLAAMNELDASGGIAYVSQIPDGLPRVDNVEHYVDIVRGKAQLRQRAYAAEMILGMALSANGSASEVLRDIGNLSAQLREEVGQKRILNFRSGAEIALVTDEGIDWIVPGFLAKGAITELGAKVKTGKTTLIMSLVRAVADGSSFLGKTTLKTPTVYLTEQPVVSFRHAMQRADLLGRDDFHVLLHSDLRGMPWPGVAAAAASECKRVGAALLVVDTLPQFAGFRGDSENNSGDALTAMQPLQQAAADGIGTILIRHERKSGGDIGDSGRGSSAFAGAVDIVLSLRRPEGNSKKTLRVLQALSRFSETPPELLVELTENGYISLGEPQEAAVKGAKDSITAIASKSEVEALELKELTESAKVPRATAQRAVKELAEERILSRVGEGKRGSPFRYFLTENRFGPTSDVGGQKESVKETCPEARD